MLNIFSKHLLVICIYFFESSLFSLSQPVLKWGCFLVFSFTSSLYILDINPLYSWKRLFLLLYQLLVSQLTVSLNTETFRFQEAHFLTIGPIFLVPMATMWLTVSSYGHMSSCIQIKKKSTFFSLQKSRQKSWT